MAYRRLVRTPYFVISTGRSGTTLLRYVLGSHSAIHAPHELHLADLRVEIGSPNARLPMANLGLGSPDLEYLLWDALLHHELTEHGKSVIVDATPSNAASWKRLAECWPDARFIFLLRHPARIADSLFTVLNRVNGGSANAAAERDALTAFCALPSQHHVIGILLDRIADVDRARAALPGHTVRYEDLTTDPVRTTRALCDFIGVPWEESMLDYDRFDHGPIRVGLGDWGEKIRSGRIQPAAPSPTVDSVPPALLATCRNWGYLPD